MRVHENETANKSQKLKIIYQTLYSSEVSQLYEQNSFCYCARIKSFSTELSYLIRIYMNKNMMCKYF